MTQSVQDIPEVFIFCWYPDEWLPRAIIADISKLDDMTRKQMEKILQVGDGIIETVWQRDDNESTLIGFRNFETKILVDDEETIGLFSTWQLLADHHHMYVCRMQDDPNHWIHFSSDYYINDNKSDLSPLNLHAKLSSLTYHPKNPDNKFKVKHCVLVSDIPVLITREDIIKPLRFFYNKYSKMTANEAKNKLKSYFNVENLHLTNDDYGVLTPENRQQWLELKNNKFEIDDIMVIFI